MRIVLIVKPTDSVRMDALRAGVERLRRADHAVHVRVTFEGRDARRFARAAARRGADLVIAAGGDGTVNGVVSGLMGARAPLPRLAVVPLGTANDFARGRGIPLDVAAALEVALEGRVEEIDVGRVNRRWFINVSTGGFGVAATQAASGRLKRRLGGLAYVFTGARMLLRLRPQHACFLVDGRTVHDGPFVFFAIANAVRTGGGTRVAPRADVRDGRLDLSVARTSSRLDFLSLLPDLRAGTQLESPDVLYLRGERVEVRAASPLAVNIDGEPLRARRLVYTLHPQSLEMMLPQRTPR